MECYATHLGLWGESKVLLENLQVLLESYNILLVSKYSVLGIKFTQLTTFLTLSWCQNQDKKNETIPSQIGPRVPSGLIYKVLFKKIDAHSSFVFFFLRLIKNIVSNKKWVPNARWHPRAGCSWGDFNQIQTFWYVSLSWAWK